MRRGSRWFVAAAVVVGLAGTVSADPFGGFSKDRSTYLVGVDRICTPVAPGAAAVPACRKAAAEQVSKLGFSRGTPQRGATAAVTAEASGSVLRVRDAKSGAALAEWTSPDVITRVRAVFASDDGTVVAVEYDARVGGRAVAQAVGIALPAKSKAAPQPAAPVAVRAPLAPGVAKALAAALKTSDRLLARKQWAKADAAYRKALAIDEHSAAARFGLAASLARRGSSVEAIAELEKIGRSPDEAAPVWLVEARTSAHFAALRSDPGFRRASGIDPDPARAYTAYERLVGQGGHWEQPGLPCQEPTVSLKLDRTKRTFVLKIRTRCQGDDETTTLDGRWKADGAAGHLLTFPNPSGPDETLECALAADRSGEDALSCTLEDIAFTMRVVRR